MKILYIGVFDAVGKSTNTSQLMAFKALGHDVVGYNYRQKAQAIGPTSRDKHLCSLVRERSFDLVIFSKCNLLPLSVFEEISELTTTCLWFMDPLSTLQKHPEICRAAKVVDYFCFDKKNIAPEIEKSNKNCFHVCEGYDETIEQPQKTEKEYDVSFIGNIYGNRKEKLNQVNYPVKLINNAFGPTHSMEVGKTRINLNFCTDQGASDRIYKIMAAGGFLLTDEWEGRQADFVDGKDLVIFNDADDLNAKIEYYLKNDKERKTIAKNGNKKVQKFNRLSWAKKIIYYYNKLDKE